MEVIEKFQKDELRIVLYKYEKNIEPDDDYCSPDAAKIAYEKAEITGADIIHFKNLIDEPNGISIQNGRSKNIWNNETTTIK